MIDLRSKSDGVHAIGGGLVVRRGAPLPLSGRRAAGRLVVSGAEVGAVVQPRDPLGRHVRLALEHDPVARRCHDRLRRLDESQSRRRVRRFNK